MQQATVGRFSQSRQAQPARQAARWRIEWSLPLSAALLLAAWELLVRGRGVPAFILPAPSLIWQRFVDAAIEGTLWIHVGTTLAESLGGFGLALISSLVLGYLLAQWPAVERAIAPYLAGSQAVPVVAIAPLIVLWVGTDIRAKILVAALITFFPILISTIIALRSVPRELREMALISGANRWQLLRYVELPLALPVLFGGVKTGLALATTGAVVGEFVAGRDGLGALINIARGLFDTPLMFVALAMLVLMTLGFYLLATLLERLLVADM